MSSRRFMTSCVRLLSRKPSLFWAPCAAYTKPPSTTSILPLRCNSTSTEPAKHTSTVDEEEIHTFNKLAPTWWNEQGELASLHTFNQLRVPWIKNTLINQLNLSETSDRPLQSLNIIDVGCGGGILTEPLARLGANVTGVDAEAEGITVAKLHKQQDTLGENLQYLNCNIEDLVKDKEGQFDALVASEVIEHVTHKKLFVESCCKLVKPGGSIFMTTLNKTMVSYALAVVAAERVAGIVPVGTHEFDKFISPEDVQQLLDSNGCQTQLIHGLWMNPVTFRWSWSNRTDINYALHAIKT